MLPIKVAREEFYNSTQPDRLLLDEHERRMGQQIEAAIKNIESFIEYEVPWLIPGPWPPYDEDEVAIELITRAREKGYTVELVNRKPNIIRVWGWAEHKYARNKYRKSVSFGPHHPHHHHRQPRKQQPPPQISIDDVKRGVLSSRLKQRLIKLKNY